MTTQVFDYVSKKSMELLDITLYDLFFRGIKESILLYYSHIETHYKHFDHFLSVHIHLIFILGGPQKEKNSQKNIAFNTDSLLQRISHATNHLIHRISRKLSFLPLCFMQAIISIIVSSCKL